MSRFLDRNLRTRFVYLVPLSTTTSKIMFEEKVNDYRISILQKHENLIRVYDYFDLFLFEQEYGKEWTDFLLEEVCKFYPEAEEVCKGFDYDGDRYVEYLIHPITKKEVWDLEKSIERNLNNLYNLKWISLHDIISRKLRSDRTFLCKAILSAHNGSNNEDIMHLLETKVFI